MEAGGGVAVTLFDSGFESGFTSVGLASGALASALGSLLVSPFVSVGAVALALAAEEDAAAAVLLPRGLVDGEPFAFAGGAGGAAAAGSDDFAFSVFEG